MQFYSFICTHQSRRITRMHDFTFTMPAGIRYGIGMHEQLGTMLKDEMQFQKVFILTGRHVARSGIIEKITTRLAEGGLEYQIFAEAVPEPAVEDIDRIVGILRASGADAVLAVGGGSPIDTAKAVCMLMTHEGSCRDYLFGGSKTVTKQGMPLIAIPTTAGSGSEMTAAAVIEDKQKNVKLSITSPYLVPKIAVIDPQLQTGMPPFITATTGMDALTHAIESYVSKRENPVADLFALKAIKLIARSIRTATADGNDIQARADMALASTLAGVAFMNGGLGIVHGISQTMGAIAHVAHGEANALLLPYCMEKNAPACPERFRDIAQALGEDVSTRSSEEAAKLAAKAAFRLAEDLQIPTKLHEVGVTREMFDAIVEGTMAYRMLAINPMKITEQDVRDILEAAYA